MKNLTMLVWLTQLGFSVAVPPVCSIWLAVWLRNSRGWGSWILWVGVAFGIICAADGLRVSLLAMERLNKNKEQEELKEPAPVSFNDHD